jgi:hypothetical protein
LSEDTRCFLYLDKVTVVISKDNRILLQLGHDATFSGSKEHRTKALSGTVALLRVHTDKREYLALVRDFSHKPEAKLVPCLMSSVTASLGPATAADREIADSAAVKFLQEDRHSHARKQTDESPAQPTGHPLSPGTLTHTRGSGAPIVEIVQAPPPSAAAVRSAVRPLVSSLVNDAVNTAMSAILARMPAAAPASASPAAAADEAPSTSTALILRPALAQPAAFAPATALMPQMFGQSFAQQQQWPFSLLSAPQLPASFATPPATPIALAQHGLQLVQQQLMQQTLAQAQMLSLQFVQDSLAFAASAQSAPASASAQHSSASASPSAAGPETESPRRSPRKKQRTHL